MSTYNKLSKLLNSTIDDNISKYFIYKYGSSRIYTTLLMNYHLQTHRDVTSFTSYDGRVIFDVSIIYEGGVVHVRTQHYY